MLFPTYQFLVFFLIVFSAAIFLKEKVTPYKWFLLAASLVFYSFWSPTFLGLLLADTSVNYVALRAISGLSQGKNRKRILFAGVAFNILYLGIFKYYNFFVDSLFSLLNSINIQASFPVLQILAPAGVSFYTFRMISHLVDLYNSKISCPSFLDYAVYITYFPQIASGPIARAKDFYAQLNSPTKYDYDTGEAISLILSGLFKKYTLSSFLFDFTQSPFSFPQQYSRTDLLLAALSYSCLIYADFSGYSDLANGISSLLGFKPVPNFNMPYQALSLQEFWKRWHISLSEWLRDYLYIPLGGNRAGKVRKYINLLLTMLIGGFWHGAGVNFIVWGGLHGLGLVANHLFQDLTKSIRLKPGFFVGYALKSASWSITFTSVTVCWIFFNTKTWDSAAAFIAGAVAGSEVHTVQFNFWQLYAVLATLMAMNFYGDTFSKLFCRLFSVNNLLWRVTFVSAILYTILMLGPSTVPPFIYFNF
ncbi:MBOAT family O-acyltransferase [Kamptonema formosum]|uniref:MBOAT family O-acyltransferase n=1 Tax=Kamptonema formosum TaxID=331992 RepID=UPI00034CF1A8|nr:MBOAT family O-acyltransferase [Oscillatoria sp. PCC 10802]